MNRLLLYIFGSIVFTASGGFPERFLNLCTVKGIKLRDLKSRQEGLIAETSLSSFRSIRFCAKRSGMRIRIVEKKGLPFLYARMARHTGVFAGIALCAFLLFFYSRSIWRIDVSGNQKIESATVMEVLEKNGISAGCLKKDIDYFKLRCELYNAIEEIAWLNIGIDGSRLMINLREATPKPKTVNKEEVCNVLCKRDGVIEKMLVYDGEALVHEGDGVTQGELLVSGIVYHEQAKRNTFHHAYADIFAHTKVKNTITIKKKYKKTVFTGKERRLSVLRLFRVRVPLYLFSVPYRESEVSVLKKALTVRGVALPIVMEHYDIRQTEKQLQTLGKADAAALARTQRKVFESKFSSDTKILKRSTQVSETDEAFIFEDRYELYENVAKIVPVEIEEKNVHNNIENSD